MAPAAMRQAIGRQSGQGENVSCVTVFGERVGWGDEWFRVTVAGVVGSVERPFVAPAGPFVATRPPLGGGRAVVAQKERVCVTGHSGYGHTMERNGLVRTSPSTATRAPARPGRRRLGLAVGMVMIGSFMPWISTALGNLSGAGGPGIWTFYASMLGLGGALLPMRRLGAVQAAILSAVAVALPVWQLARVFDIVGFGGWMPGPGLVLVLGGGVLAGAAAVQLYRDAPA